MSDARRAILTGTMEAARAHAELNVRERWEREGGRIDVFGAIDALRLPLMFQPLEGLLGAFLVRPTPGVLVNTKRPLSVRRYTAAHELGHFRLGHEPSLDGDDMIGRTPFPERVGYDAKEVEANAFAVAFLLPQWFVAGQMRRHGWAPAAMRDEANVYQLALRAGISYEATCYALKQYRVIDAATCDRVVAVKPKTIKQALVPGYQPQNWYLDVWELGTGDDGVFLEATVGDLMRLRLLEHSGGGYTWDVKQGLAQSDLELIDDGREPTGPGGAVGGHVVRRVTTRAKSAGFGSVRFVERRPWERGDPLSAYQLTYDFTESAQQGLWATQRDRMLGGNG